MLVDLLLLALLGVARPAPLRGGVQRGPGDRGALALGEAAFFAQTRVTDGAGGLRELVDKKRLIKLARESWPGYFEHIRQMRTAMEME